MLLVAITSCNDSRYDSALVNIAQIISTDPYAALKKIDSIDTGKLSEKDLRYYDLLTIKAQDKAFIVHTSDSVILKVIDYYSRNKEDSLYVESLYYGGRVYYDMGDFPTALNYFQNALDIVNSDSKRLKLKGNITAQIAYMLKELGLNKDSADYSEIALETSEELKDSVLIIKDLESLGITYMYEHNYKKAKEIILKARELAKKFTPNDVPYQNLQLAWIHYKEGNIDSALNMIRPVLKETDSLSRPRTLEYAIDIYLKSNLTDTALMYAKELVRLKNSIGIRGYEVLLSPEMKDRLPVDSILLYVYEYKRKMDKYISKNGSHQALMQESYYNYQIHQRKLIKSEAEKTTLQKWIIGILFISLFLTCTVFYLKYRNKSQLLQLKDALNNLSILRREIEDSRIKESKPAKENVSKTDTRTSLLPGDREKTEMTEPERDVNLKNEINHETKTKQTNRQVSQNDVRSLRERLVNELLSLREEEDNPYKIPIEILQSEVYLKIKDNIQQDNIISEESEIWKDLQKVVLKSSPDFIYRFGLLTNGNYKESDMNMALLVKAGISISNISKLMGRAKSTISYRRSIIGYKIFDRRIEMDVIDDIIRML